MQNTTNFNLKVYEGTDLFNPLTVENENAQAIDAQMKANQSGTVGTANHLLTGSVHAITRVIPNASMFRFTATSKFTLGDSFTVDGVSVTALMPNGTTIPDDAFVIGSTVLCSLVGQLLTIYSYGINEAEDSKKLGGELPSYYATKQEVDNAKSLAESAGTIARNALDKTEPKNFATQQVVGKYGNKNIYKRILSGTNSNVSGNGGYTSTNIPNIDKLISLNISCKDALNSIVPAYSTDSQYFNAFLNNDGYGATVTNMEQLLGRPFTMTVEYTLTTD